MNKKAFPPGRQIDGAPNPALQSTGRSSRAWLGSWGNNRCFLKIGEKLGHMMACYEKSAGDTPAAPTGSLFVKKRTSTVGQLGYGSKLWNASGCPCGEPFSPTRFLGGCNATAQGGSVSDHAGLAINKLSKKLQREK